MIFDPLHYLALLEQKGHAVDQAAPLLDWQLPEEFGALRLQREAWRRICPPSFSRAETVAVIVAAPSRL